MFERYTEKTRRVIFFARYEASQYGSRYIDTEHLLLGVAREDRALIRNILGPDVSPDTIRPEIEKSITRGKRISTSVEVPLSPEAKRILMIATEEADRLANRYVEPRHILLGILTLEGCLGARILTQMGVTAESVRRLAAEASAPAAPAQEITGVITVKQAEEMISAFLASLNAGQWKACGSYFADHVRYRSRGRPVGGAHGAAEPSGATISALREGRGFFFDGKRESWSGWLHDCEHRLERCREPRWRE